MSTNNLPTEAEFRAELVEVFSGVHFDAVKVVGWGLVASVGIAWVSVERTLQGQRVYSVGYDHTDALPYSYGTAAGMAPTLAEAREGFERNGRCVGRASACLGVKL